jgi:hypothetical protein
MVEGSSVWVDRYGRPERRGLDRIGNTGEGRSGLPPSDMSEQGFNGGTRCVDIERHGHLDRARPIDELPVPKGRLDLK